MADNEINENEDVGASADAEALDPAEPVEDGAVDDADTASDVDPHVEEVAPEASAEAVDAADSATEPVEDGADTASDVEPQVEAVAPEASVEAEAGEVETKGAAETTEASTSAPAETERKQKRKRLPRHLRPARTRPKRQTSGERKPIVRLPKPEADRGRRQERQGVVVSDAMDKTIVVKVDTIKAHRRYGKVVRRSAKFHAHDEGNEAKVGDVVRIVETRPLSATKRWRLAEIVEAAK